MRESNMKQRWLHSVLVACLLFMVLPTSGNAAEDEQPSEVIDSGKLFPGLHLTSIRDVSITGAVYGDKPEFDSIVTTTQRDVSRQQLQLQQDFAMSVGDIALAKQLQTRYYEQLIRSQALFDAGVVPLPTTNESTPELIVDPSEQASTDNRSVDSTSQTKQEVSAQSNNILTLGASYDISFPQGYIAIFDFTAVQAGEYKFYTGPYGGNGALNDTVLYLYADPGLTQLIALNDDANGSSFSELKVSLPASATVYLVLAGYNYGAVNARLSSSFTTQPVNLVSNLDVNLPAGSTQLAKFTPTVYGTYTFTTTNYAGNPSNGPNDTVLFLYSDANLANLIAYNDDYSGTFSQITINLIPGRSYYLKLQGFNGGAVYSRLSAAQSSTAFTPLSQGAALQVSRSTAVPEFIQFTPTVSGTYQFKTSPYGGTGPTNDTLLEIYSSPALTTPLQVNDNANGTLFSQFNQALTGGTSYYLVLREAQAGATYANLTVESINPLPTVNSLSGPGTATYTANGSFDLFAYGVTDQASGVASVQFHTWTSTNGQDDLVVHNGTNLGSGTWKAAIPYSQHLNEVGTYITDVYVQTNGGTQAMVGTIRTQVKASGVFQYVYHANGVLNYIQLPNGQRLVYEYDANGNLLRVRLQHP